MFSVVSTMSDLGLITLRMGFRQSGIANEGFFSMIFARKRGTEAVGHYPPPPPPPTEGMIHHIQQSRGLQYVKWANRHNKGKSTHVQLITHEVQTQLYRYAPSTGGLLARATNRKDNSAIPSSGTT